MNCDMVRESMSPYIDNELDDKTKKQFTLHLESCHSCREDFYILTAALDVLTDMTVELPENFSHGLRGKLMSLKTERKLFIKPLYLKTLSAVAAVFLVLFIARGVFLNMTAKSGSDAFMAMERAGGKQEDVSYSMTSADAVAAMDEAMLTPKVKSFSLAKNAKYVLEIDLDEKSYAEAAGVFESHGIPLVSEGEIKGVIYVEETDVVENLPVISEELLEMGIKFIYEDICFDCETTEFKGILKKEY